MAPDPKQLALNAFDAMRERLGYLMGTSHAGKRNLWQSFGYPQTLTIDDYERMYRRNDIASRIVQAFPQATWREKPTFSDADGNSDMQYNEDGAENENYSPFVESVWAFLDKTRALQYLERVDRLSGIGHFGVLLIGYNDGAPNLAAPLVAKNADIVYMSAYSEKYAKIESFEQQRTSPRYGLPLYYTLTTGGQQIPGQSLQRQNVRVHWSRVMHVAEFLDENEIYGTPRLESIYNRLMDLEKVVGSSAETFWLNSRGGLSLMADKDAQISTETLADMKEQADEWEHQLRRTIAMQGVTAQMLSTIVADPKPNVETLLQIIAGAKGIPMRILTGSERGELASSQDENNWNARIDERQNNHATPNMLRPFIQRAIETGNVIRPANDEWWVEWPDSAALSPEKAAEINRNRTTALKDYLSAAGAEDVVPIAEFRQEFLGLPPQTSFMEEEDEYDETADTIEGEKTVETVGEPMLLEGPPEEVVPEAMTPADTAMNGAQVAALKEIVEAVGLKTLPTETAVQLILVAFPTVTEEIARAIVAPMEALETIPTDIPDNDNLPLEAFEITANRQTLFGKNMINHTLKTAARVQTLYVRRDLLNGADLIKHFKAQGIATTLPAKDMHVTIAYSKAKLDWTKVAHNWWGGSESDGTMSLPAGGMRMMELFGPNKDVLVLLFTSGDLTWRHKDIKDAGASWDYPDYQPHVTITFDAKGVDLDKIKPYTGELKFGVEIFEPLNEDWKSGIKENAGQNRKA